MDTWDRKNILVKKKIIVTGGAGYIGSHTVVELIAAGFTPIIIVTNAIMMDIFTGKTSQAEQDALEKAGNVTTEATVNMRTGK